MSDEDSGKGYIELPRGEKRVPKKHIVNEREGMKKTKRQGWKPVEPGFFQRVFGSRNDVDSAFDAAHENRGPSLSEMLKKSNWSDDNSNMFG